MDNIFHSSSSFGANYGNSDLKFVFTKEVLPTEQNGINFVVVPDNFMADDLCSHPTG